MTEADRPGTTVRLSAPTASRAHNGRVGHSVNIRRTLSYVEGPSSFKLANKSGPGLHRHGRRIAAPSSPRSRYPSLASLSHPPSPHSLAASSSSSADWRTTGWLPSVVVVILLLFTAARRLLSRAHPSLVPPSLPPSPLASSSGSAKFIAASFSPAASSSSSFLPSLLT